MSTTTESTNTAELLTLRQVAAALGCSYRWANELVRRGSLPATAEESGRGREWRIRAADVEKFRTQKAKP